MKILPPLAFLLIVGALPRQISFAQPKQTSAPLVPLAVAENDTNQVPDTAAERKILEATLLNATKRSALPVVALVALDQALSGIEERGSAQQLTYGGNHFGGPLPYMTDANSLLPESRAGIWLIEAQCSSISDDLIAQWDIVTVFNGPQTLLDKQFRFSYAPAISHVIVSTPTPRRGDRSLWAVTLEKGRALPNPGNLSGDYSRRAYGSLWPIGQVPPIFTGTGGFVQPQRTTNRGMDYDEALTQALAVAQVANAPRADQIRLLGLYAQSSVPNRSAWAILTLAESGVEGASNFLLNLANADPREVRSAPDAPDKLSWSGSTSRFSLWRTAVTSSADDNEGRSVVSRLVTIAREENRARDSVTKNGAPDKKTYVPPVSGELLFEWLRLAGANAKWTPSARAFAVSSISHLSFEKMISRSSAWDYLLDILKSHPDFAAPGAKPTSAETQSVNAEVSEGAFRGLGQLRPLTPEETATLQALQPLVKSPVLKSLFDFVLDK